jgi:hypothetical protein
VDRREWSAPEWQLPLPPIDGTRAAVQYWHLVLPGERPVRAALHRDTRVSESSRRPQPSSPQDGDVVVTREVQSHVHYTLRQLPGMVQFSAPVRDEAVRLARSFSRQYAVDVWYSETGTYRLLEVYRPRTSSPAPVRQVATPRQSAERIRAGDRDNDHLRDYPDGSDRGADDEHPAFRR